MLRVRVKNFQSIRDTTINIDGFTVVTGPNNSGKSALMRAIRGPFENTSGTAFVRHGTTKTEVEVDFGDGNIIQWSKGKSRPTYVVNGGEPIHPGRAVPDEVNEIGVRPVQVGGQLIWPQFAPQFTGQVFLLDQPGSMLAEAVADVERVGQLNRALKAVQSDGRTAASKLRVREQDRQNLTEELSKYEGIDAVRDQVTSLDEDIQNTRTVAKAIHGLAALRQRLQKANGLVVKLQGVESISVPEDDASSLWEDTQVALGFQSRLQEAKRQIAMYEGVEQLDASVDCTEINQMATAMGLLTNLRIRLSGCVGAITKLESQIQSAQEEIQAIESQLMTGLEQLGECPMCGKPTCDAH